VDTEAPRDRRFRDRRKAALEELSELPKDFVLMLSERGGPSRRCYLVWATDDQLGVEFERPKKRGDAAA